MGIPHLITYLQPYAESKSLKGENLVVDGPGLAYHIHHLCLRLRPGARNPFDAAPSYKELGEATIVWLNELQARGAILHKIFFDGFLPLAKYPTRTKRLSGYTKQLNDYYALHTNNVPSSKVESIKDISSSSLFVDVSAHPSHSKISAPPFLVPAVLDALFQDEKYSEIVSVVPGEADLYCAQYLRESGGTVVSGDSDLLVHDLGPNGAVAFLKDIDFTDTLSTQFVQYQPTHISQRLGLDTTYGLRALAFELVIDSQKTFRQLLQRAVDLASIKEHNYMYDTFITEYEPLSTASPSGFEKGDLAIALSRLDPRISEYIHQFQAFGAASIEVAEITASATGARDDIDVFLPFLLDCPIRTSAWESSTHIRQLAYGLVNLVISKSEEVTEIIEHRRQHTGSRGRSWQIPIEEQIQDASQSLLSILQDLRSALHEASSSEFWRAVALYQDMAWAESNNKNALSDKLVFTNNKGKPSKLSWDSIHFCAQMHGTYYSYRILKQILSVVVLLPQKDALPLSVVNLHAVLEDLPALSALSSIREETDYLSKGYDIARVSTVRKLLQSEEQASSKTIANTTKSASKKKRKRSKSVSNSDAAPKKSTNPFDLLGDM